MTDKLPLICIERTFLSDSEAAMLNSLEDKLGYIFFKFPERRIKCDSRSEQIYFSFLDSPQQVLASISSEEFLSSTNEIILESIRIQVEEFLKTYNLETNSGLGA